MLIEKKVDISGTAKIEMSIFEMYKAILQDLGVCLDKYGTYSKVENNQLVTYRDMSRHGSVQYEPYKYRDLTPDEVKVITVLMDLEHDIKKVSYKKELDNLIESREDIDYRIKKAKENLD